ncbi:pyridoxine/pyridoxamine 5'-phosphate oxidase isoform X2 [Eurytemora carolleeae]|uniref:pyridoxine/pyridoxamine 5'-phosphate oxidase isoform X2 n=1 Tax=Eurytemora carolleeae TaxID=1294199 RepID=UPI000C7832C8|nr:pyridoxine/pyridoxamine 5'-phosphate oxidase isoform X2 [Eurytemora carolleeae]|eukprot:XP_023349556.1 pyridoxine/pyridoxamine 5'-phosphate oxidase-like isoform X2 [Eurytemora affinis]
MKGFRVNLKKTRVLRNLVLDSSLKTRKMSVDIHGMRKPYNDNTNTFEFKDLVSKEPFAQFKAWFNEASHHERIEEANAMCLATATKDGLPSARMVLLKKFGAEGFTFYTNYTSRKAAELEENPRASLVFYWEPLKKSVRVEGKVIRIPASESKEYFESRPISSQIGAWVSDQSKVIKNRSVLTEKEEELTKKYSDGETKLPYPEHWGGYRVEASSIEFWQGQSTRIHDRIRFRRASDANDENPRIQGEDGWIIERLAP